MAIIVGGTGPLLKAGSVKLDAAGGGTITLEQVPNGQNWLITVLNTFVEGPNTEPNPQLRVFRGYEGNPANQIDSTYNGRLGTSPTYIVLGPAESIVYVYAGGQPGRLATATIHGIQNP